MEHFNQLTPAEAERLAILLEELGEAQQRIGKILRHGYEASNPNKPESLVNREGLELELADVRFAIDLLIDAGDISETNLIKWEYEKALKIHRWTHHQLSESA